MATEPLIRRYRTWYATLVRLYPKPFRQRFGKGMEQTFNDLCHERLEAEHGLFGFALWMFLETSAGILRENIRFIVMQNITKRLTIWAIVVAAILMIPLLGKWPWTAGDFVFGVVVLFGAACVYELVARRMGKIAYRAAVGLGVATALILVWVNAAVGIIGDGPVNLMYFGVIAVGMIGAILARLGPRGMARTLFAMALAQMLVPVLALVIWNPPFSPGVVPVFCLNAVFAGLFVGSALLFRRASAADSHVNTDRV